MKATVTFADAVYYTFDNHDFDSDDNGSSDAEERLEDDLLNQAYITWMGSGSTAPDNCIEIVPASAWAIKSPDLLTFLSRHEVKGRVDIMEFCGGSAGVSRIAIRRRLRTGMNADIVCGIDLTTDRGRRILFTSMWNSTSRQSSLEHLRAHQWAVGATTNNRETYIHNRRIGEEFANLYAKLCLLQMASGRHWLLDNPHMHA